MHDRLGIGPPLIALLADTQATLYRLGRVAAARIVMRQLRELIIEAARVYRFQRATGSLVQQPAAFVQQGVVCDVTGERMFEDVFDIAGRGLLTYELTQLQRFESLLQFL